MYGRHGIGRHWTAGSHTCLFFSALLFYCGRSAWIIGSDACDPVKDGSLGHMILLKPERSKFSSAQSDNHLAHPKILNCPHCRWLGTTPEAQVQLGVVHHNCKAAKLLFLSLRYLPFCSAITTAWQEHTPKLMTCHICASCIGSQAQMSTPSCLYTHVTPHY